MAIATVSGGTIAYGTGVNGQALTSGSLVATVSASSSSSWTLEGWVKAPTTLSTQSAAFFGWGTGGSWIGMRQDGQGLTTSGGTGISFPQDGAWHHVAVVCMGDGRMENFLDGIWINEFSAYGTDSTSTTIYLGGRQAAGYEWNGGLDEVRYSFGVRYAAYTNFTKPTAPLTVDSTTSSLWRLDGNGNDSGSTGSTGGTTNGSTGTTTTPSSGTYTASQDLIAIPERGWWLYTDTHLNGSGQTNPLDQTAMIAARTQSRTVSGKTVFGSTLVFRYYFLDNYAYTDTIAQADLDAIASDLIKARNAGVKLIVRFAYSKDNADDAPLARAQKQIDQIVPVLNAGADIIHSLQAGFVGRWGEWYYSNSYGDQNSVTDANWSDRLAVLNRLVTGLDSRIFVQVRYVGIRQRYLNSAQSNPGGYGPRIGLHNDAFTASYADYGTYTTGSNLSESVNRDYLANMTAVPVGGESETSGDASWTAAQPQLDRYNWSYFNPNYNPDVQGQWTQDNWDTVTRQIGHRLRLVSANVPSTIAAGTSATAQFVLTNDGWAVISRNRPVNLIFDNGAGTVVSFSATIDLRTINSGQQVTATVNFIAPSVGTYSTYIALPDASSTISSRPEYAIQLANSGIWDSVKGRHALSSPVNVTATNGSGGTGTSSTGTAVKRIVKLNIGGTVRVAKLSR